MSCDKTGSKGELSRVVTLVGILALPVALLLFTTARTPRAQMNVMQVVAVLFFLIVVVRQWKTSSREGSERSAKGGSRRGLLLALAIGAVTWTYMIPFYFISDDFVLIDAARHTELARVWHFLTGLQPGTFFRPVGFAFFFLDYHLWHYWTVGYHMTNLSIHLMTIAGLFFLCEELTLGTEIATAASLIYTVLPVHAEAVAWIVARFDLLSSCLVVWAVVFYVKFRNTGQRTAYIASLGLFLLAALSKENAYVLPFLLILAECLLMPSRRLRPTFGFFLMAAILFCYRWILLGGIGGYSDARGRSDTLRIGFKTFEGLFIRGPAQLLLGYNWLQPSVPRISIVAALTAAILLVLAFCARPGPAGWKRSIFFVFWIIFSIAPAHPLLLIGPGLTNSRVLHLGSVGLALLIAQLLVGFSSAPRVRAAMTGALVVLLSLGTVHNLAAWDWTSQLSRDLLAQLKQLEPSPLPQTEFVFQDMPETIRGIFFLRLGLSEAVRIEYARDDLNGVRALDSEPASRASLPETPVVQLQWTGETPPVLRRIGN